MSVTAVVVAADQGYLEHTLVALREQRRVPERVILADASAAGAAEAIEDSVAAAELGDLVDVIAVGEAKNFGDAVRRALDLAPEVDSEWLWLLHDDSPPESAALAELLRATAASRAVGIAGCKQVGFESPSRLLSAGVRYTRAGRRLAEVESGEIDQGQYDDREDVYAVGTAGMLIRTSTWNTLGGTDPALGPFLDGAELSRRVRLAGERVIVVPTAKVRHARAGLWHGPRRREASVDGANSFLARRLATLHFRLITINAAALVFIALAMLLAAPVRALWRIASDDLALALDEIRAPLIALTRLGAIFRSRRAIAKAATSNRKVLRPLYATRAEVRRLWWHRWRAHRVQRRRQLAPSELEIAERRAIGVRRRATLTGLIIALAAIGAILIPKVFAGSAFTFPALIGGGLSGIDDSYRELWERAFSAWAPAGDGSPVPTHPFGIVLAVLATLTGSPFGVSAHAAINVLLALALPIAGISMWFAAGALTRSVLLRGWAAATWAFLPVLSLGLNHGRIAAVVAHLLLPLLGLALARAFGVDQRDVIRSGMVDAGEGSSPRAIPVVSRASGVASAGAAAAAGLLLAAICASAPILFPGLGLVLIAIAIVLRRGRIRLLLVAAPTIVLFIPQAVYAGRTGWANLLLSPGHTPINLSPFAADSSHWLLKLPWHVASGWAQWPAHTAIAASAAGVLGVIAVVGLFRTGTAGTAARWGWLLTGIGLCTAVGAQHLLRSPQYDWLGSFQRLPEWAGPGASLAGGGLLLAVIATFSGARQPLSAHSLGWRHGVVALGIAGLVAVMVAGGVNTGTTLLAEPQWQARTTDPLPALARQTVTGSERSRVLMIAPTGETVAAELWRSNGPQFLDPQRESADPKDDASESLQELVAELSAGAAQEAGPRLAEHAIGLVLLPAPESAIAEVDPLAREEFAAALDGVPDLERVTENESGTLWRVTSLAARAQITAGKENVEVASGMNRIATTLPDLPGDEPATLTLAERADSRWRATLDGAPLRSLDVGWQQAFEIPAGASGELTVEYAPTLHRAWRVAAIAVIGFCFVLSLPVRRRPEVEA